VEQHKIEDIKEEEDKREQKIKQFYNFISESDDLNDNLNQLCNYLKYFTGATGVYIGKLGQPVKEIQEDDDDKAHLDEESAKVI